MTALIFGANGQDGYYLNQLLQKEGISCTGISRNGNWLKGDVRDWHFVKSIVEAQKPTYIFNLAAESTTRHNVLFENHQTIGTGCLHILEAVKLHSPATKVFLAGSGLQFLNTGNPIDENTPFAANNAYAVERIHSAYAARYFRSLDIQVYIGYFFNHDSPLRSEKHVSKMITEAVKRIKNGSGEVIEVGDLATKKEWGFAGDIVRAVWLLIKQQHHFEAVLGTGEAFSIQEWIEECFHQVRLPWKDYVTVKEGFTAEFDILVSHPARIEALGWEPKTTFQQLASMMLKS